MTTLVLLAILAQGADAANTCHALKSGNMREVNPVLGQTCASVISRKAAMFAPLLVLPKKGKQVWSVGLIAGGGLGFGLSVAMR